MALTEAQCHDCYRRIGKALYNVLYRRVWNRSDAEELLHEAFERVWAQRGVVPPERVDALVYRTALNLAHNRLRWRALWQWVGLDDEAHDEQSSPEHDVAAKQLQQRVRQALESLDELSRRVLLLSEFSGMDTRDIAQTLNIAPGTVGSRKNRALAKLRERLQKESTDA